MLSQALHDEIVTPLSVLPNRAKTAFVRSSSMRGRINSKEQEDSSYLRPYQRRLITPRYDERPSSTSPEEVEEQKQEGEKNLAKRVRQLERNNLSLRRMIELFENNNPGALNLSRSLTARCPPRQSYLYKSHAETPNGPPTLRQGRVGSSWRHIKQTNDCGNANLLFIDGTVRINDTTRFPPTLYGYPPKLQSQSIADFSYHDELNNELLTGSFMSPTDYVRHRPMNLSPYTNQFNERARQGFEYWAKERKFGENTKTKAKLYTTGAYKTFYGLSDAIMKT